MGDQLNHTYDDPTLLETLKTVGVPHILTTRSDGEAVYVKLSDDGESLVEVDVDEIEAQNG